MKKLISFTALFALSTSAFAGFTGERPQGGFKNNNAAAVTTVQQAIKAADDTPVTLEGHIIKRLKDDDEFLFRDSTGEIVIEVDDHAWKGQDVGPNDKITLEGHVDTHKKRQSSVDVHNIKKH